MKIIMKIIKCFCAIAIFISLAACTTNDYSTNLVGASDYSTVAVKDFKTLGIITVYAQEVHYSGPFGFKKRVEGSKITFSDLMQEAAKLEADDIINIRIDMNSNYSKGFGSFFTGWSKTYTYTGTALAIKYTDKLETEVGDPQLSGLPKSPEQSGAVRTTRAGKVILR
ncbi:MAG: hypothetical protein FWH41_03130 [Treponema sp.]|nr:hypothetical protein [Treponema sp.]